MPSQGPIFDLYVLMAVAFLVRDDYSEMVEGRYTNERLGTHHRHLLSSLLCPQYIRHILQVACGK